MRDPNRLYDFYEILRAIHQNNIPDWRFGQFILNFIDWYYYKNKRDIFYIEDDEILENFKVYISENLRR